MERERHRHHEYNIHDVYRDRLMELGVVCQSIT